MNKEQKNKPYRKSSVRNPRSDIQMYSSLTSAPIMVIAGLFIGYYGGESISPGFGTIGAFIGAFLAFGFGLIEVFNLARKDSKKSKLEKQHDNLRYNPSNDTKKE